MLNLFRFDESIRNLKGSSPGHRFGNKPIFASVCDLIKELAWHLPKRLRKGENTSYSAMLHIPESVPPPESDPCDSGIPFSQHLHKCTEFLGIPESQLALACLRMISPCYRSNSATEFRNHNLHWLVYE